MSKISDFKQKHDGLYQFGVTCLLALSACLSFGYTLAMLYDRAMGLSAVVMAITLAVIIEGGKLTANRELVWSIRAKDGGRGLFAVLMVFFLTALSMLASMAFELKSNHVSGAALVVNGQIDFDGDREIKRLNSLLADVDKSIDNQQEIMDALPSNYTSRRKDMQIEIGGKQKDKEALLSKISARERELIALSEKAARNGLNFLFAGMAQKFNLSESQVEFGFTLFLTAVLELLICFFAITLARFDAPVVVNQSQSTPTATAAAVKSESTPTAQSATPAPVRQTYEVSPENLEAIAAMRVEIEELKQAQHAPATAQSATPEIARLIAEIDALKATARPAEVRALIEKVDELTRKIEAQDKPSRQIGFGQAVAVDIHDAPVAPITSTASLETSPTRADNAPVANLITGKELTPGTGDFRNEGNGGADPFRRVCEQCGTGYQFKTATQRFCSSKCRLAYHKLHALNEAGNGGVL